jgi:hypothetical protein
MKQTNYNKLLRNLDDDFKKYGTISSMVSIDKKPKKDSNLLDVINNLKPSGDDNELYLKLLEVIKNHETERITSKP